MAVVSLLFTLLSNVAFFENDVRMFLVAFDYGCVRCLNLLCYSLGSHIYFVRVFCIFKFLLPLVPYVLLWETGRSRRILGRRTAISTAERVVACRVGRGVTPTSTLIAE